MSPVQAKKRIQFEELTLDGGFVDRFKRVPTVFFGCPVQRSGFSRRRPAVFRQP